MVDALSGFDPQATFDEASAAYEEASRDYWQQLSRETVRRLRLQPGERVLDVPCGNGPSLVMAAELVGPAGQVVGIDYADGMLSVAREKVRASGLANIDVRQGDMTAIAPPGEPYDALLCVLGVFFVDDMAGLVRSFRGLVRPGGRLAVTVFGERVWEPLRQVFLDAAHAVAPDLEVVQPWRRMDNEPALRGIFEDAGLGDVLIDTVDEMHPLPSAADWWRIVMGSSLRRAVVALGEEGAVEVRARCDRYVADNGVRELATRSRYAIAAVPG